MNRPPPPIQCQAWAWALRYRREYDTLPTGKEIAEAHNRHERWGRIVKQRREEGHLPGTPDGMERGGEPGKRAEPALASAGEPP